MDPAAPTIQLRNWSRHALAAWGMVAAFGTYACMYGFRKPFSAAGFSGGDFPAGFKVWLVTAQVLGYALSKFIGIRVISGMPPHRRAMTLLALIGAAELALVLFGILPAPFNVVCLFLNGLPLGMVFGLVLGFLEGRRMTEALVAGLCTSFILADGFAKTVGTSLLERGVPERWMPAAAGLLFIAPLIGFVWMLRQVPPPDSADIRARSARTPMTRHDRVRWIRKHGPGIGLISLAYLLVTVVRSLRADFAPELWRALGATVLARDFTRSELWVAAGVLVVNGGTSLVQGNRRSFFIALGVSCVGLLLAVGSFLAQRGGSLAAFPFMVFLGLGLYLPYVAIHTTVFERLIAMTRDQGNIGFLMYLADAAGYLGYVGVMAFRVSTGPSADFLDYFRTISLSALLLALGALLGAARFFARPAYAGSPVDPAGSRETTSSEST
jgi:hypothetical protein